MIETMRKVKKGLPSSWTSLFDLSFSFFESSQIEPQGEPQNLSARGDTENFFFLFWDLKKWYRMMCRYINHLFSQNLTKRTIEILYSKRSKGW